MSSLGRLCTVSSCRRGRCHPPAGRADRRCLSQEHERSHPSCVVLKSGHVPPGHLGGLFFAIAVYAVLMQTLLQAFESCFRCGCRECPALTAGKHVDALDRGPYVAAALNLGDSLRAACALKSVDLFADGGNEVRESFALNPDVILDTRFCSAFISAQNGFNDRPVFRQ